MRGVLSAIFTANLRLALSVSKGLNEFCPTISQAYELALARKLIACLREDCFTPEGGFLCLSNLPACAHFHAHANGHA
jgi:hypothetical protein